MKKKKKKNIWVLLISFIVLMAMIVIGFIPILQRTRLGLDLKGGFEVLYQVKSIDGNEEVSSDMVTSTYKTIEKRINVLGVSEPEIIVEGKDRIRVKLAGVTNQEEARSILSKAANLTFRDTDDHILMDSSVLKNAAYSEEVVNGAVNQPVVKLNIKDTDTFYRVTKAISESDSPMIVIWLDYEEGDSYEQEKDKCGSSGESRCISAATVNEGFSSNSVIIQGNFTKEEAETLAKLINSGSLSTKLEEISSKTVPASFGEKALEKTFIAGLVGIVGVILFMTFLYHFAGLISGFVVLIYTFLVMLVFYLCGGVLTLPGIAALVIGVGMAVDACVISFSRIKEELYEGKPLKKAFIEGNKNSFTSIFDGNLTTLVVAVILFIFGESSVKGFATMLIISIIVTMLIMVILNRVILGLFVNTDYFNNKLNLFIKVKNEDVPNLNKNEKPKKSIDSKIDFIRHRSKYLIGTLIVLIIGIICFISFGFNLGIDFKGGSSISIQSETMLESKAIEEDIKSLNLNQVTLENVNDNYIIVKVDNTLNETEILNTQKYFKDKYNAETDIGVVSDVVKNELIKNAFISLGIASIAICIYISLRFKTSFAIPAIISLLHDVFIVIAFFSIFRLEVASIFIAAILSIIGYSINDTIVIFDRIRENLNKKEVKTEKDLEDVVNTSLKQTFTRSVHTSITTLIPILALIIIGAKEILNFNVALLVGLIAGTLSSLFIASQLWILIEKRQIGKKPKKKWYDTDDEVEELQIKGINS